MPVSRRRRRRRPDRRSADSTYEALVRRLAAGARIDYGDFVLTAGGRSPSYAEPTRRAKVAVATKFPEHLGLDPFSKLRLADKEIDDLVTEVDDWIRVGNHVRVKTVVRRTLLVGDERIMRTDHHTEIDDPPADWARRAARIIADLRSQLDASIFELVSRAAPEALTEQEKERISFPIDDADRPQSLERLRRKLPYLTDASLDAILDAQPSRMPEHARSHLWLLNKLNNLDKHRRLNVIGTAQVVARGPLSRVFGEGEILIAAQDIMGEVCEDGCHIDAMVAYGDSDATQFAHEDGTFEPIIPLCRFLRGAFADVVGSISTLLDTEGVLDEWDKRPYSEGEARSS